MALTKEDLNSIRVIMNESIQEQIPKIIDESVPKIIDERVPELINDRHHNATNDGIRDIIRFEMKSALRPIERRLDRIEESLEETRSATNRLIEWADVAEHKIGVIL